MVFSLREPCIVTHGKVYHICYRESPQEPNLWDEVVLKDGEDQAGPPASFASYIEYEDGVRRRFKPSSEELRAAPGAAKRVPPTSAPPAPGAARRTLQIVFCLPATPTTDAPRLAQEARRIARAVLAMQAPGAELY